MVLPVLAYRYIRYGYTFRRIPLTQGKYAIVDPDDYWHLSKHKWYAAKMNGCFYAVRGIVTKDGKRRHLPIHRCIIKVPDNMFVDHINHNGLDNRKANLRPATHQQNVWNRKLVRKGSKSRYIGLQWDKRSKKWQVNMRIDRQLRGFGSYTSEIEAAKAYDRAAKKHRGEFAVLNFPEKE